MCFTRLECTRNMKLFQTLKKKFELKSQAQKNWNILREYYQQNFKKYRNRRKSKDKINLKLFPAD